MAKFPLNQKIQQTFKIDEILIIEISILGMQIYNFIVVSFSNSNLKKLHYYYLNYYVTNPLEKGGTQSFIIQLYNTYILHSGQTY